MKKKFRQMTAILLVLSLFMGVPGNAVFAAEQGNPPQGKVAGLQTHAVAEAGEIEAAGTGSAGELIAKSISGQQAENAPNESGSCITGIEVDGTAATVSYSTVTGAQIVVAIYADKEQLPRMLGSGRTMVSPLELSVSVDLEFADGQIPEYFIATAFMLDADSHEPLCEAYTTELYTKEIQDLKGATVDDFEQEKILNLDDSNETNFGVYNDEVLVLEADYNSDQMIENGDVSCTIYHADESFTNMQPGDKFAYTYEDGTVLLVTVAEISVDEDEVTIQKVADCDLTDYFDYMKIEGNSSGKQMQVDESTMDAGVAYVGNTQNPAGRMQTFAFEGGGDASHSVEFTLNKKLNEQVSIKGGMTLGLKEQLDFYLSLKYQYLSVKIDIVQSSAIEISGKVDLKEIPLARLEVPVAPCVNVGFTPSFLVRASGEIALEYEWKATLGFSYDTENKVKSLCQGPASGKKIGIEGSVFVGIKATPHVSVIDPELCKASLEAMVGIDTSGTPNPYSETEDILHDCRECITIKQAAKASVKLTAELMKGIARLELKLCEIGSNPVELYYSAQYDEFGWGTCPHTWYKAEITAQYMQKNMKGALITVKNSDTGLEAEYQLPSSSTTGNLTDEEGKCSLFLKNGSYTINADADDLTGEAKTKIQGKKKAVNVDMDDRLYQVSVTARMVQNQSIAFIDNAVITAKNKNTGKELDIDEKTNALGQVTFEAVAGTYLLEARTETLKAAGELTVGRNSSNSIILEMEEIKFGTVHMTVLKEDGTPAAGARVGGTGLFDTPQTDSNGQVSFMVEVGAYTFDITTFGDESAECSMVVKEGEQSIQVQLLPKTGLHLTAVDEWGNPVPNAVIAGTGSERKTDANGKATLRLKNGTYSLQVYTGNLFGDVKVDVTDQEVNLIVTLEETDFFWALEGDALDTLRIWGREGELVDMPDYEGVVLGGTTAPWMREMWEKPLKRIIVENGMRSIGNYAFASCYGPCEIILPESITHIGERAFLALRSLSEITLPQSLTYLGAGAFENCNKLDKINFPENLTYIGAAAFENCNFSEIVWPSSISAIEPEMFYGCGSLSKVTLPEGLTDIGKSVFYGCSLKEINFPQSLLNIGDDAFSGCSFREVILPEGITSIPRGVFRSCTELESVTLPKTLNSIGEAAFCDCIKLKEIILPEGLTDIGESAFCRCWNLSEITLPKSLTLLGEGVFQGCSSLGKVTLPPDIRYIHSSAFKDCVSLSEIELPESLIWIADLAFSGCSSLSKITLPENVSHISGSVFYNCNNLSEITLSESLTEIGQYAFRGCSSLSKIILPASLTKIGYHVFDSCKNLQDIYFKGSAFVDGKCIFPMTGDYSGFFEGWSVTIHYPYNDVTWDDVIAKPNKYGISETCSLVPYDPSALALSVTDLAAADNNLDLLISDELNLNLDNSGAVSGSSESDSESEAEQQSEVQVLSEQIVPDLPSESIADSETESETEPASVPEEQPQETVPVTGLEISETEMEVTVQESEAEQPSEIMEADEIILDLSEPETSVPVSEGAEVLNEADDSEDTDIILHESVQEVFAAVDIPLVQVQESQFRDLMPGRPYFFAAVKNKEAADIFAADNLVYAAQGRAAVDGTLEFRFAVPEDSELTDCIFGESKENNMADAVVTIEELTADGTVQYPAITVYYGGEKLVENADYRVNGALSVLTAGTYSIIVKGINDYCGSITCTYTVREAHVHTYGEPTFLWDTPSGQVPVCQAQYRCLTCDTEVHTVLCEVTQKPSAAVCGAVEYTASVVIEGRTCTDTYTSPQNHTAGPWETVKGASCTEDGLKVQKCSRCSAVLNEASETAKGHQWGAWREEQQPTVFEQGINIHSCTVCGTSEKAAGGAKLQPTIKVNAVKFPLKMGQSTKKLKVTGLAEGDSVVSWKSGNPKIVKVSSNGRIKAGKKPGKAVVTITLASGLTKRIKVTVQKTAVKTKKIITPAKRLVLKKGQKHPVLAEVTPITSLQKVTYSTSNKKAVSVDRKGILTAKGKGTAKITVTSGAKKAAVTVKVR